MNLNKKGKKKHLLIIGVHKAATTSLYTYLIKHNNICAGKTKEIHYYTPLRYNQKIKPFDDYLNEFSNCSNNQFLLDASPSYLYGNKKIASKINEDLDDVKLIVLLRNPTERFISFYNFLKATLRLDDKITFEEFMERSYKRYIETDLDDPYSRAFREGCYVDFIEDWMEIFGNKLKILFVDDLKTSPQKIMYDLCDWLNIDNSVYNNKELFTISNKTQSARSKILHKLALSVDKKLEYFLRKNQYIKTKINNIYYFINGRREKEIISEDLVLLLNKLYSPKNKQLSLLLKQYNYNKLPIWLSKEF